MLRDIVVKNKTHSVERTGCCKFCGQIATVNALERFSEDDMNELATEQCDCDEAGWYALQKGQKERAHAKIDALFSKDHMLSDEELQFLHSTVDPIVRDWLQKVTVEINGTLKMTINKTKKNNVKITRTQNVRSTQEA